MSLHFREIAEGSACCGAETDSRIAVGFSQGNVRVFSGTDHFLERVIDLGKHVTHMVRIPGTELIAVICDGKCTVHNLETRRLVLEVDSSSARFLTTTTTSAHNRLQQSILVIGSSYKLRILRFENSKVVKTVVVNTPDRQKVRSVGNAQHSSTYTIIGSKTPILWHLDLNTSRLRPVLALNPTVYTKSSHKYVLTGTEDHVFIGSSTGAQLIRLKPLKVVKSWEHTNVANLISIEPSQLKIPLFLMRSKPEPNANKPEKLHLVSPITGSVLSELDNIGLFADKCRLGLLQHNNNNNKIVQFDLDMTTEYIANLPDSSEAASLAFSLPSELITDKLRDIERSEAIKVFHEGDVDEGMRMFLLIEEQEQNSPFQNHHEVINIIEKYLDEPSNNPEITNNAVANPNSHSNSHPISSQHSIFSIRTAATANHYHPLDGIVSYLVYTRRKLRLAQFDGDDLPRLDTALFRCYIQMGSPLVAPLLRSQNHCDPAVVKETLLARGKWRELVWFLKSRNDATLHREALDLMVEHKEPPESIVSYLEKLDFTSSKLLHLAFEYAKPILEQRPELAHQLFYEDFDGIDSEVVSKYFAEISKDLEESFVKFRVLEFGDQTPALHNTIAKYYAQSDETESELLKFLRSSKAVNASELIQYPSLPCRAKALLYEQLGDFSRAIDLYLDGANSLEEAQSLAESHQQATYLFDKLLGYSEDSDKTGWMKTFLNSSSTNTDLDLSYVLSKLPKSVSIMDVNTFLKNFLAHTANEDRKAETLQALSHTALAEYSIELAQMRKQKYSVSSTDACSVCHKRIGRALTGVSNGNELVHYACLKLL